MDNVPNWCELPLELLTMIIEYLQLGNPGGNPTSDGLKREALLHCRQVNSTFKAISESVLEKQCLEFWSRWKPWEAGMQIQPKTFPHLRVDEDGDCYRKSENRFLYNSVLEESPVPTKSICMSPQTGKKKWHFQATRFLIRFGSHLTSLTLHSFMYLNPLPAQLLQKILRHTPNLKGLTLQLIKIQGSIGELKKTPLPSLPHLAHIRIWTVDEANRKFNLIDWILELYKQQIISLETDRGFKKGDNPNAFKFLKRLKVWNPNDHPVRDCLHFPALQFFSLVEIRVGGNLNVSVQQLLEFLWKHSKTLKNLYLDIARPYGQPSNEVPIIQFSEVKHCVSKNTITFPNLKTFSIFYPRFPEEVAVLKEMLKMFPNLETLKLIRFGQHLQGITDADREQAKLHLGVEKYWSVCKYLKTMTVYMDASENSFIFGLEHVAKSAYEKENE